MDREHQHYRMYKPYGVLSQMHSNDVKQQRKKQFLRSLYDFPEKTMPIGRLDEKSEGLLLLTTDGKLSDTINRSGIVKEYYALLDGVITDTAIKTLQEGVTIGIFGTTYRTQKCIAERLTATPLLPPPDKRMRTNYHRPTSWIRICIKEGKFRQVRKMTAATGFPTLRLVRVRVGNITIDGLQPGTVDPLVSLID